MGIWFAGQQQANPFRQVIELWEEAAQPHPERQQDDGFQQGRQRGRVPVAPVHGQVPPQDGAALPVEGGAVAILPTQAPPIRAEPITRALERMEGYLLGWSLLRLFPAKTLPTSRSHAPAWERRSGHSSGPQRLYIGTVGAPTLERGSQVRSFHFWKSPKNTPSLTSPPQPGEGQPEQADQGPQTPDREHRNAFHPTPGGPQEPERAGHGLALGRRQGDAADDALRGWRGAEHLVQHPAGGGAWSLIV
jgi:hypothetical protein